jgi:hypothetical protein
VTIPSTNTDAQYSKNGCCNQEYTIHNQGTVYKLYHLTFFQSDSLLIFILKKMKVSHTIKYPQYKNSRLLTMLCGLMLLRKFHMVYLFIFIKQYFFAIHTICILDFLEYWSNILRDMEYNQERLSLGKN